MRLSYLVYGNNGRCLPDGRKGMRRRGKIEDVKKKIHARARKMLWHGIGNFVWASGSGRGEVGDSRKKLSGSEGRAKGRVRLLRARGSADLRELWLCYAGPLAEKRKSEISGRRHRPKPIPWERNSWGN